MADLHIVGVTNDGKRWHNILFASRTWQSFFRGVKDQESNSGTHQAVASLLGAKCGGNYGYS